MSLQAMCKCFGIADTVGASAQVASLCCCREQLADPDGPDAVEVGATTLAQLQAWWLHSRPAPGPGLTDHVYLQVLARQVFSFVQVFLSLM